MKNRIAEVVLVAAGVALGVPLLAGCNDTAKAHAAVRQPAPTPAPTSAKPTSNSMAQAAPVGPTPKVEQIPLPANPPQMAQTTNLVPADRRAPVDILAEQVQAAYDAGRREAAAGNEDKAQAEYNRALDLMLKSGYPVDKDPKLSKLFDEIGDVVQADDKTAPEAETTDTTKDAEEADVPSQPAPIDSIEDLTLPAGDPRLAAFARRELISVKHDLPLTVNESVLQYLSYFTTTKGRAIVEHGLTREGQYDPMIRRVLREEGVPEDLIYLAQAESAFLPDALSRVGARGIWQFMPYRGEEYDLARSYWIDERSDPEKATRAAARHMRDLYEMFGDWYLVMAAYNSGPLNVSRAVERTGYADFWELKKRGALPKQTQNYVPIILAMALVGKDPAAYGIHVTPLKPPVVEVVKPGASIDLHLVADASGADIEDLHTLNPALLRNITPSDPNFELKMPHGTAQRFEVNVHQVPEEKWTSWRLHQVESGENLASVARSYHVSVAALQNANHLDADAVIPAGFFLTIPAAPAAPKLVHYRVQRGDTLAGIADRYDVTVEDLRRWNHIRGGAVKRGLRLTIYAAYAPGAGTHVVKPKSAEARTAPHLEAVKTSAESHEYRVKPGETLYSIARVYGTTVDAIRRTNTFLGARSLQAGDVLVIVQ